MSCYRLIGRLIALFVILVFVAITPPLLLAYNAQEVAVDGAFLDELSDDTELFEAAIPEIAEDMARELRDNPRSVKPSMVRLDADDWERIIYAAAPPERMQTWTQEAISVFRLWIKSGRGRFLDDVILPFGEIRANIVNDPHQTVLRTLTEAQPDCSTGQEPLDGSNALIPRCRPAAANLEPFYRQLAGRWQEEAREVWRQMMPEEIAQYPDDISLAEFIEREEGTEWDARMDWRASRWGLRAARWLMAVFIAGQCFVALALVALFAARSWREVTRWVGTPLVLAGAFTLVLAFLFFVGAEISIWFIPEEEIPIGVQEVLEDAFRAFSNDVWPPMAWQGGMLVLIGLGLWVLSFLTPGALQPVPSAASITPTQAAAPSETEPASELSTESPSEPKTGENEANAGENGQNERDDVATTPSS